MKVIIGGGVAGCALCAARLHRLDEYAGAPWGDLRGFISSNELCRASL